MKEIKAHIRPERVEAVAGALHEAGIRHFTTIHVRSFGGGPDSGEGRVSLEVGEWYTEHAKLEFVCPAPQADALVTLILEAARTGEPGDGIVFVYDVDLAVKVRTGAIGRDALV